MLEYDRAAHRLTADVQGDVRLATSGGLEAEVGGAVSITGKAGMTLMAPSMQMGGMGGGTQAAMQGTFQLKEGDIIVEGISFLHHVHDCPHGGQTGEPR